jgi:hypothetical protein
VSGERRLVLRKKGMGLTKGLKGFHFRKVLKGTLKDNVLLIRKIIQKGSLYQGSDFVMGKS